MANDKLFKKLCKPETMKIGWYLAQDDSRDDFVRDPVSHADYASNLAARLEYLIEQLQCNRYQPKQLIEVDVPKSDLSVRPGNVLPIEEASVLHAIIYLLAPILNDALDSAVYSYRLRKDWKKKAKRGQSLFREVPISVPFLKRRTIRSISPFIAWYEQWPAFDIDTKKAVDQEGYTHLTKTDVSSYFENIDLRLLHDLIKSLLKKEEKRTLQLLFRILSSWTRTSVAGVPLNRGIPQGNDVSSFLGNIYLIPLDRILINFCKKYGAKWFRYVDDVKVYTRSEKHAREAVFVINKALRDIHLNLQGSKTEILSGESLRQEHDSSKLDVVNDWNEPLNLDKG
ncbi:MAG TPA: RNA-directed DNA polymerase [archaeon]|nr:RNA-directed DNA polymerase [archaeon]